MIDTQDNSLPPPGKDAWLCDTHAQQHRQNHGDNKYKTWFDESTAAPSLKKGNGKIDTPQEWCVR